MDAKSKANFINSIASGVNVHCDKCGTNNEFNSKYCISCSAEINISKETKNNAFIFETAKQNSDKLIKYVDSNNVFAQGLPDWSIEPPHMVIRRR